MQTTQTSAGTQPCARRWQALIVLAISLLVVSVGNTILNVALPTIREELDASSSELQWIVDGYVLLFAGLLLAAGSLGDRFGRRRALVVGLVTFGLGSVLAALSASSTELIALAGTSTADIAAVVGLGTSDLRARLAAIVAALDGPPEPVPSSTLRVAA